MANLRALGYDGVTVIYLASQGDGEELTPFKSIFLAEQFGIWNINVVSNSLAPNAATDTSIQSLNNWLQNTLLNTLNEVYSPVIKLHRSPSLITTPITVKTTSTKVFGWSFYNRAETPAYIKIYDDISNNITIGFTSPIKTIFVPPGDGETPGVNVQSVYTVPQLTLDNALTICATLDLSDSSTTPPALPIYAEVNYK